MREAGISGIHRRKGRGCTRRDPSVDPADDLVNRAFDPVAPDRLWVMDVTEHPTPEGKLYLAVVLDAWSRRVVGWSIADHIRSELVVDALQMAIWRRRPPVNQTVAHSDHGSTYTSWAFGRRLRGAGLLGSMGSVGDCFDNSVAESFFGTLQLELLDEHRWESRQHLALAIFDWIESLVQPQAPAQLLPDAQSRRLRSQSCRRGRLNHFVLATMPLKCSQRPATLAGAMTHPAIRASADAGQPHNQPVRRNGGSSVRSNFT